MAISLMPIFKVRFFEERQGRGITTPLKVRWNRRTINLWKYGTRMLEYEESTDQSLYQSFVYTGIVISSYLRCSAANLAYEVLAKAIDNPYKFIELLVRDRVGLDAIEKLITPRQLFTLEDKSIIPPGLVFRMFDITDPQGSSEVWWLETMEIIHPQAPDIQPLMWQDNGFSSDDTDEDILGLAASVESLGIHSIHSSDDE